LGKKLRERNRREVSDREEKIIIIMYREYGVFGLSVERCRCSFAEVE
jgi:hypothetical protein